MAARSNWRPHKLALIAPLLLLGAGAAWFFVDPGFRSGPPPPVAVSDATHDAFEQRVRTYLLDNPEVIVEAMQRLEERRRKADAADVEAILKSRADEIYDNPNHPIGGNPEGDVSLVEFFDYNCPYCRQVVPAMQNAEKQDPNLRVIYIEFPILGSNSMFAAKAALAAHRQGKYLPFHMALMQARGAVDERRVIETAATVGVDLDRMKVDMNDPAIEKIIRNNLALAQALRINGTPSFIVGDEIIRGAADLKTLQTSVARARNIQR